VLTIEFPSLEITGAKGTGVISTDFTGDGGPLPQVLLALTVIPPEMEVAEKSRVTVASLALPEMTTPEGTTHEYVVAPGKGSIEYATPAEPAQTADGPDIGNGWPGTVLTTGINTFETTLFVSTHDRLEVILT
jgi:hypothetical protein